MAEAEWRKLFLKRLTQRDLVVKFTFCGQSGNHDSFLNSIPPHALTYFREAGKIPATLQTHHSGGVYAESQVQFEITLDSGTRRCIFELPPPLDLFLHGLDVKVEHGWRDGQLHLRAAMANRIYGDIEQAPTPWRLLGRKQVGPGDVRHRKLTLTQEDGTEFYNSIPTEELKHGLMSNLGLPVKIWIGELDCVSSQLKALYSTQMDVISLGIDVCCRTAFQSNGKFLKAGNAVEVYYQWSYGIPYLAIAPEGSNPPRQTGEKFSEI